MSLIKTITIDDFYSQEQARSISQSTYYLPSVEKLFGTEIENFNLVPPDADKLFTEALNIQMHVVEETSGVIRHPKGIIHFEDFSSTSDWVFVVALQKSTFNIFENSNGVKDAREHHVLNYNNLFEWDLMVNYVLKPGQGVLFRPWLFHSFDTGLIQVFKLNEKM